MRLVLKMMSEEMQAVVAGLRQYLQQTAERPEWAGWLQAAQVLAPHSGTDLRRTDDSYRWDSKIALWGTQEQWRELGYEVQAGAKSRLAPMEKSDTKWEVVYSEQDVAGGPNAAVLRAPKGAKTPARASSARQGVDPSEAITTLEFLLQVEGWKVFRRPDERGAEAHCKYVERQVWVQRSGDLWTDFHRLAHEAGHALLYRPESKRQAMWEGEIEAEAVAMLLGQLLGVEIARETVQYILYRSTGRPSPWVDFKVETVVFSERVLGVVEAAVETIRDLTPEMVARHAIEPDEEYESV
jgi:hypothetical protein